MSVDIKELFSVKALREQASEDDRIYVCVLQLSLLAEALLLSSQISSQQTVLKKSIGRMKRYNRCEDQESMV